MENETGHTIKKFWSDNGGKYTSIKFKEYLKSKGISQEFTNPHTLQENGISERKNQTLNDKVRTSLWLCDFHHTAQHILMHRQAPLPLSLWEDAICHALWIENRTPTQNLPKNMTPYKAYFGIKPDVSMLRIFGCQAWAHVPMHNHTSKLEPHAIEGVHTQCGMRPISCWCHALIMHWTWHVFNQYPSVL